MSSRHDDASLKNVSDTSSRKGSAPLDRHGRRKKTGQDRPKGRMGQETKKATATRKLPPRIAQRSDPRDWTDLELMSIPEAAALFFPDGILTTTSLRTAVRDKILQIATIAGKHFTTKAAIAAMSSCRILEHALPEVSPTPDPMPRTVRELRMKRSLQR